MNMTVGSNFELIRKIGAGSFGQIYIGEDVRNNKKVAIKLESRKTNVPQLSYESKLYVLFSGCPSVPRLHWYGSDHSNNIMVIDLLGRSIEDNFIACGQKLSLKTVLMLADQMLSCIQYIHSKNFIHNDIKPDNFVMGRDDRANEVFVIDFGLSKKYRDPFTHEHISYADGRSLTGTPRYASVAALKGVRQTRRDDMESLGFVWMYLLRGNLPWMGITMRGRNQKFDKICEVKEKTTFESLCEGYPKEFQDYLYDVRNLKFDEEPNYALYRERFRKLFIRKGYVFDYVYDWTIPAKKELIIKVDPHKNRKDVIRNPKPEAKEAKQSIDQKPVSKLQQDEMEIKNAKQRRSRDQLIPLSRVPSQEIYEPDPNLKTDFNMNNLPKDINLPNGPFPRPIWRNRYPRWMAQGQRLPTRP